MLSSRSLLPTARSTRGYTRTLEHVDAFFSWGKGKINIRERKRTIDELQTPIQCS